MFSRIALAMGRVNTILIVDWPVSFTCGINKTSGSGTSPSFTH